MRKKIAALLLALMMVFSLGTPVSAHSVNQYRLSGCWTETSGTQQITVCYAGKYVDANGGTWHKYKHTYVSTGTSHYTKCRPANGTYMCFVL